MAYETASASDPNDLLAKLAIFAAANGWTVDYNGPRTNVGGASQGNGLNALALSKGGNYFVLYHDTASSTTSNPTPRIRSYLYVGPWVGTNGTDAQASASSVTSTNKVPGPYAAYHFFTDSARTYLHVVLEVESGRFAHFHLGAFNKAGGGADATYATGLRWDWSAASIDVATDSDHHLPFEDSAASSGDVGGGVVRADSEGLVPRYVRINKTNTTASTFACGGWRVTDDSTYANLLASLAPSALTGRAVLIPLIVAISRSGSVSQRSIVGTPHDLRLVRIDNLEPGAVVTIGADSWKTFPIIRKNGPGGIENSGTWGYAYRVVS